MRLKVLLCGLVLVTLLPRPLEAQAPPRQVRFTGVIRDGQGDPLVNVLTTLTFAVYREPEDATPLWVESQAVLLDAGGRFTALLGATQAEGLPADLFVSGEARWLGVRAQGRPEIPSHPAGRRSLLAQGGRHGRRREHGALGVRTRN